MRTEEEAAGRKHVLPYASHQTPPPASQPFAPIPVQPAEMSFLEANGVTVTSARVVIGPETYAVANITSVRPLLVKPNRAVEAALSVAAAALLLIGLALRGSLNTAAAGPFFIFAAICLVPAAILWFSRRPKHAVHLKSSSGESKVLLGADPAWIHTVVDAINQAIISRR